VTAPQNNPRKPRLPEARKVPFKMLAALPALSSPLRDRKTKRSAWPSLVADPREITPESANFGPKPRAPFCFGTQGPNIRTHPLTLNLARHPGAVPLNRCTSVNFVRPAPVANARTGPLSCACHSVHPECPLIGHRDWRPSLRLLGCGISRQWISELGQTLPVQRRRAPR
jgi:hypothetical protein